MADAQINITPFSGSETDNFNEFEQLITGAIGVAAIAAAQQANFLQLHLKDALRYFLTLPEATRLVFEDSITALRNRFTQDDLREIRIIKLENQKFNPKTDTVKNFLAKLRTEANKAYLAPEIVVAPTGADDPEARSFERETAARDSALQMSENRKKNEQIKRFFIKSMPNWLKPKLLERPDTDTIDQLCSLASQQIAIREMCNREEYFDDGFNEITESNTDKMLKAITVISNNQKELEQKLEQRTAPKMSHQIKAQ